MRECYSELNQVNEEMVRMHTVRRSNHEELLEALRLINLIIQQAARLRGNYYNEAYYLLLNNQ